MIELLNFIIEDGIRNLLIKGVNDPLVLLVVFIILLFFYRKVILKDMKTVISEVKISLNLFHEELQKQGTKIDKQGTDIIDLKETMVTYKIMNQECMKSEIIDISRIIRMSADSIANICVEYVVGKRNNNKDTFNIDELMVLVTNDVQRDREIYHSSLVENGVSPYTIKVWEEVESIMFPKFGIYCREFALGYIKLSGNGELEKLIRCQGRTMADRMYDEFMIQLKSKVIEK